MLFNILDTFEAKYKWTSGQDANFINWRSCSNELIAINVVQYMDDNDRL